MTEQHKDLSEQAEKHNIREFAKKHWKPIAVVPIGAAAIFLARYYLNYHKNRINANDDQDILQSMEDAKHGTVEAPLMLGPIVRMLKAMPGSRKVALMLYSALPDLDRYEQLKDDLLTLSKLEDK